MLFITGNKNNNLCTGLLFRKNTVEYTSKLEKGKKMMDGNDFYDYFVEPLLDLDLSDLAKVADYALPTDWVLTQNGPDDTAEKIADVIHGDFVDTGACEVWSPRTFIDWYVDGVLRKEVVH